jgi:predicted DNA-binding transcriptional regulator AlpA
MQYLRANEVSEIFSVSTSTVWRWAQLGLLPKPRRIGLRTTVWEKGTLDEYIKRNT